MKQLYKIEVATGLDYESIADLDLNLKINDKVVVQCERYMDFAKVIEVCGGPIEDEEEFERQRAMNTKGRHIEGQKIPKILRIATPEDLQQAKDNDVQAFDAHNKTLERIKAHGLEMKLIQTHYAFDRKLIIFQFSADGRIDFRELLRDLSGLLKVRVELRQVGVRDEAAILGGVGTCGRPFCCAKFLNSFNSINVKMAKQQGLSLNPQNISGCCGRLKCCLQFEAEIYKEINEEGGLKPQPDDTPDVEDAPSDTMFDESIKETIIKMPELPPAEPRQPHGSNNNGNVRQRQRNNNGQNNFQRHPNNSGTPRPPKRPDGSGNNLPRNNNNNNNQPRLHKNPPKRPMPPPDKQVKHPLPPPEN